MKRVFSMMMIGVTLACGWTARGDVMVLELQKSSDLKSWQKVPVDPSILGGAGTILQSGEQPSTYYRLQIKGSEDTGFLTAIPLSEASREAVDVARQFLRDFPQVDAKVEGGDPEGTWNDVVLGPVCYPVYDPAVDEGRRPAYLQFKVIKRPDAQEVRDPLRDGNGEFLVEAPDQADNHGDFGSILVSLTRGDFPVAEFSDQGPTSVEMLLRRSKADGPIKVVRFDDGFLAAEDAKGNLAGTLGNVPFQMSPEILSIVGTPFEGEANDKEGEREGQTVEFPSRAYGSYEELKEDVVKNPLFQEMRRFRAQQAQVEWDLHYGKEPSAVQVGVDQRTLILPKQEIREVTVSEPNLLDARVDKSGFGVWLTGLKPGGSLLQVVLADGSMESHLVIIGDGAQAGASLQLATSGWTPWSYWYAGNWGDQRRYNQFSNDPLMCSGGASGCGPTAWGMLYGWWDRKGSPRCLKNTSLADAPLYNDSSVRDCNRYLFPRLGTFCVSGQAATMPWSMKNGYQWGLARGAGFYISWNWGVPYVSPWCVSKARSSIQSGRPSIIGLGFYWHYPLAYGYAQREYKILGITFSTSRWFKCNMGWGGSSPQWRNSSSVWFATNGYYY